MLHFVSLLRKHNENFEISNGKGLTWKSQFQVGFPQKIFGVHRLLENLPPLEWSKIDIQKEQDIFIGKFGKFSLRSRQQYSCR